MKSAGILVFAAIACAQTPAQNAVQNAVQSAAPPQQNSQQNTQATPAQAAPAAQPLSVPGATGQPMAKNEPEIERHDSRPTFSTGTNLVMVPVIVRDRMGKPVGDLRQADFQLFDRGKLQVITRFSVERAAEKKAAAIKQATEIEAANEGSTNPNPEAMPIRFIAYLFDDMNLQTGDLAQARAAAQKYLKTSLDPGDRAAIYTSSGQVMEEFTDDYEKLNAALLKIRPQLRPSGNNPTDCPPMSYYEGDQIMHNDVTALQVAISDTYVCSGSNVPTAGRGGGVATPVTITPQQAEAMSRAAAARSTAEGENNTQLVLGTVLSVVNRMTTTPGQRLVIVVSPGFYINDQYRYNESQLLDKAVRANVMISSIDARGLYTIIPGGDVSTTRFTNPATDSQKVAWQHQTALIEGEVLGELAEGTGGTWFHNNNDLVEGLKSTSAFPEYQYVIGFSPQNLKYDGGFHKLKVVVKLKTENIQARRGYYAPRHAPNEAEQAKQEIHEAMFSRDELLDIPVTLQTQFFKALDGIKLAVLAKVDLKAIKFEPKEGRQFDELTIVTGLFDRNGQIVDNMTKIIEMRLKPENFSKYLESGLLEKTSFDVHPGKYVLRLVVRDSGGQTMAARNGVVEIPEK